MYAVSFSAKSFGTPAYTPPSANASIIRYICTPHTKLGISLAKTHVNVMELLDNGVAQGPLTLTIMSFHQYQNLAAIAGAGLKPPPPPHPLNLVPQGGNTDTHYCVGYLQGVTEGGGGGGGVSMGVSMVSHGAGADPGILKWGGSGRIFFKRGPTTYSGAICIANKLKKKGGGGPTPP